MRLVAVDGSGSRLVPAPVSGAQSPAWSPDGSRIVFAGTPSAGPSPTAGAPTAGGDVDLWTVNADGTGWQRLVATPSVEAHPAWSPEGERMTFTSGGQLFVVDADGANLRRLPTPMPEAPDSWYPPIREPVWAPAPVITRRHQGADRILTAIAVSQATRERADTVVVARHDAFPDALTAAPLAIRLDAPVLLAPPGSLPALVAAEVRRLGATRAVLLGSTTALSGAVEAGLRAAGVTAVERLGGVDRFDTARLVAARLRADAGGLDLASAGGGRAYLVEGANADPGRGWSDAVAVSALAAREGAPILLTRRDALPAATVEAVDQLDISLVTVLGSAAAVDEPLAGELRSRGVDVDRIDGADRYETSRAVVERSVAAGCDLARLWVATGRNWPDALVAGPAAAAGGGVLLLVDGSDLSRSPAGRDLLAERQGTFEAVHIVGGSPAITSAVALEIERTAR